MKYGFETLSARDKHGYTPAHWLALDGNDELMRYLIERNAPVDLRCLGTQGPRPIHWACRKGHTSTISSHFIRTKNNALKMIYLLYSRRTNSLAIWRWC